MKTQTFQNKKQFEMMVLFDMQTVREEFRNVGKMALKRRKKENDNAGNGNECSKSTYAATPEVQEFS